MSRVKPRGLLLVLDVGKDSFGELALRLVRLGVDAVLAADLDEAELMAREEHVQFRGVLLPVAATGEEIDRVIEGIGSYAGVGAEGLAVLGPRPDPAVQDMLRARGIGLRLWEPFEDRDLRFMASALIWLGSDQDLRLDVRLPCALPSLVTHGRDARTVTVGDLSASGARVETPAPFAAGSEVELEIALPGGCAVTVPGIVRWVIEEASNPAIQPGFGVEFVSPSRQILEALARHVQTERERFLL